MLRGFVRSRETPVVDQDDRSALTAARVHPKRTDVNAAVLRRSLCVPMGFGEEALAAGSIQVALRSALISLTRSRLRPAEGRLDPFDAVAAAWGIASGGVV